MDPIASTLTDSYEGNLTRPSLRRWVELLQQSNIPERLAAASAAAVRGTVAVNCWHESKHESAAMWHLYSRDDQGIAIQSTFSRLANSFDDCSHNVWIAKVKYIDYTQHDLSVDVVRDVKQWFVHKRREFAHEQELRAITIIDRSSLERGFM